MSEKVSVHEVGVLSGNPSTKLVQGTVRLGPNDVPTLTLCVLGIPDYIGIDELWHFFTSSSSSSSNNNNHDSCSAFMPSQITPSMATGIVAIKLLRNSSTPGKYATLMLFDSKSKASHFLSTHNGKCFTSLESSEPCSMFYVESVNIPEKLDCLGPGMTLSKLFVPEGGVVAQQQQQQNDSSCSFCADDIRIGDAYPVLITLCGHCFHAECIAKWVNGWCPLCRCPLQPPAGEGDDGSKETAACHTCGCSTLSNLWECLVCANVGCDKCAGSHADAHYEQTGHVYAFNIASKEVWDFSRGVYVRRIVLNKTDGKPVEVDSKDEKIGNLEAYYLQLMDIQKSSFDDEVRDLIQRHKRKIEDLKGCAAMLEAKLKEVKDQTAAAHAKNAELKASNEQLAKRNAAAEKIVSAFTKRVETMSSNERDNDAMVAQMKENVPLWKKKFEDLEKRYKAERDKLQAEIDALQKENDRLMAMLCQ